MKEFISHPTATSKAHMFITISKQPNSKRRRASQTSSNQTHKPSTHESSHHCQAAVTPSRSTTSNSLLLTQLPIPLPSDSVQNLMDHSIPT